MDGYKKNIVSFDVGKAVEKIRKKKEGEDKGG